MHASEDYRTENVIAVPSDRAWFDGTLITAATEVNITEKTFAGGDTQLVLPANPNRILCAFFVPAGTFDALSVAPWADPSVVSFGNISLNSPFFFKLWDYPGLIGEKWYAYTNGAYTVRIVEVLRNPG